MNGKRSKIENYWDPLCDEEYISVSFASGLTGPEYDLDYSTHDPCEGCPYPDRCDVCRIDGEFYLRNEVDEFWNLF